MDQDGLFLMLKMCNGCSHNKAKGRFNPRWGKRSKEALISSASPIDVFGKRYASGSWKKCMSRKHNPRMSTVRFEELTFGHRQCVKPDQTMTIYKLRDHETNEEFLEFDENIVFQTACDDCLNIKSCLSAGHELVDWRPTFAGGRVAGTPVDGPARDKKKKRRPNAASADEASTTAAAAADDPSQHFPLEGVDDQDSDDAVEGDVGGDDMEEDDHERPSAPAAKVRPRPAVADEVRARSSGRNRNVPAAEHAYPLRASGRARTSAARDDSSTETASTDLNHSHKRKSPGLRARGTSSARSMRASSSHSSGVGQAVADRERTRGRRGTRGNSLPAGTTSGGRDRSSDDLKYPPKMEIEAPEAEDFDRPVKRRSRHDSPAAVTPSPKTEAPEAFETSATALDEDGHHDGEGGTMPPASAAASDAVDADPPCDRPSSPLKTVAERLELVKAQEAELLRQFEETHRKSAQEVKDKRAEMEAFRRAGEEALRVIQKDKEAALLRICEERKRRAGERLELIQERLKEFEAAEEAARAEARERDAQLEAERERLARDCAPDGVADTDDAPPAATTKSSDNGSDRDSARNESVTRAPRDLSQPGSAERRGDYSPDATSEPQHSAIVDAGSFAEGCPPPGDDSVQIAVEKLTVAAAADYTRINGFKMPKDSRRSGDRGAAKTAGADAFTVAHEVSIRAAPATQASRWNGYPSDQNGATAPNRNSPAPFAAAAGAHADSEDTTGLELTAIDASSAGITGGTAGQLDIVEATAFGQERSDESLTVSVDGGAVGTASGQGQNVELTTTASSVAAR